MDELDFLKSFLDKIHGERVRRLAAGGNPNGTQQTDFWGTPYSTNDPHAGEMPGASAVRRDFGDTAGNVASMLLDPGGIFKPPKYNTFQAVAPEINSYDWAKQMGVANQQGLAANAGQTALANQLAAQAAGKGPSLAQMQLRNATQSNIQNAAGMAASARGMNPAMAQRLAMQNAAGANQAAAGQSGMTRLMEQRQAQEQLGNVLAQQRAAANQMYGTNATGFGGQNEAIIQSQLGPQEINAQIAAANMGQQKGLLGSLGGGMGSMLQFAEGGPVSGSARLEYDPMNLANPTVVGNSPPLSYEPIADSGMSGGPGLAMDAMAGAQQDAKGDAAKKAGMGMGFGWPQLVGLILGAVQSNVAYGANAPTPRPYAAGGTVRPLSEIDVPDPLVKMDEGGSVAAERQRAAVDGYLQHLAPIASLMDMMDNGGRVPGKPMVPGRDDPRNDTVPALLSPREKVIPASIATSPDAPEQSAAFVGALDAGADPKQAKSLAMHADRANLGSILDRLDALERKQGKR